MSKQSELVEKYKELGEKDELHKELEKMEKANG